LQIFPNEADMLRFYQWRSNGEVGGRVGTPFVANVTSYLTTFLEFYKTCTSFILFSTFRLILNAFTLIFY